MTKYKKVNGNYVIHGQKFESLTGTRAQVWHKTAYKTAGGLTRNDLLQNKNGRIVSRSKHNKEKKDKRLIKAGFGTKKGSFGYVVLNNTLRNRMSSSSRSRSKHSRRRKHRGGSSLSPAPFHSSGKDIGTTGVEVQFRAGNAVS